MEKMPVSDFPLGRTAEAFRMAARHHGGGSHNVNRWPLCRILLGSRYKNTAYYTIEEEHIRYPTDLKSTTKR